MGTWISPGGDNPKVLVVFCSLWTWIFHLGRFPASPKVIPALLSMDPWLLDPCGSPLSPVSGKGKNQHQLFSLFSSFNSKRLEKLGKIPLDKQHPSHPTATSGGERGNFPWTSFGISGLSSISNASIKCSDAKFLAHFPKAGQGTEQNWNRTIHGDLLKQIQWDWSAHGLPAGIFVFLWNVTRFPPLPFFFLI